MAGKITLVRIVQFIESEFRLGGIVILNKILDYTGHSPAHKILLEFFFERGCKRKRNIF